MKSRAAKDASGKPAKEAHPFNPYNKKFDPRHDVVTLVLITAVCFLQCLSLIHI